LSKIVAVFAVELIQSHPRKFELAEPAHATVRVSKQHFAIWLTQGLKYQGLFDLQDRLEASVFGCDP
jgi:hypothetical protein